MLTKQLIRIKFARFENIFFKNKNIILSFQWYIYNINNYKIMLIIIIIIIDPIIIIIMHLRSGRGTPIHKLYPVVFKQYGPFTCKARHSSSNGSQHNWYILCQCDSLPIRTTVHLELQEHFRRAKKASQPNKMPFYTETWNTYLYKIVFPTNMNKHENFAIISSDIRWILVTIIPIIEITGRSTWVFFSAMQNFCFVRSSWLHLPASNTIEIFVCQQCVTDLVVRMLREASWSYGFFFWCHRLIQRHYLLEWISDLCIFRTFLLHASILEPNFQLAWGQSQLCH